MKNKLIKYALLGIFLFSAFAGIKEVSAETYEGEAIWPSEHISDIYIKKFREDGYIKYQQARFIRRSEDNAFVYCVQPYVEIDNNYPPYNVERRDYASVLNMTEEQWNKISLLAYYGYGYDQNGYDHTAKKWYAITQVLIWRVAEPNSRIVFTDSLNGNVIENKFASEIAELESLVNNHYKRPNFNTSELVVPLGQSITLTDANNVLNNYKVSSTSNATATVDGNSITITATAIGEAKVNFSKSAKKYNHAPVVYYSNHSQNVFRVGYYDPVPANITLKVAGGRVEINKVDSETKIGVPQGDALLSNAIYGIYNTSNEKIGELKTDANGYAISNYLPSLGEFYLKEESASKGYELDKNTYSFIIDENNLLATVNVFEKVVDSDVTIFKVEASDDTGIMTPEPNITFDIYLKSSNEYYKSITTDKNGYATIKLPYGTWIFKQKNSSPNFEKVEDFEIVINENSDEDIYSLISNAEITGKVKVIKIDSESKKVLVRDGIKFMIKNLDTNEYVCQNITYPTQEKVCVFETTGGSFITPYDLKNGNYQIEELEDQTIDGYVWNSSPLKFSIGENSNFIYDKDFGVILEVMFENKEVKGEFELNKVGEEYKIEDGKFVYTEKVLNDVSYSLYADGDIYSQDGTLVYKDKELVKSFKTENGKYTLTNLYLGKYCLYEDKTDANHVLPTEPYCFEIKYVDQYTEIVKLSHTFKNYLKKADLVFSKLDFSTSEAIPGTTIEIYMETKNGDVLVGTYITDSNGEVIITDMPVIQDTKFYILEKNASEGYILNTEKMYFSFTKDGEVVKSTMTNEKITSTIKILKVDEEGNLLAGVKIGIYDLEGNEIGIYTTNEFGLIEVELEYNDYMYKEIEALDGFVLDENEYYFSVTEDDAVIELKLINELEEIEVPNTSSNSYTIYIPVAMLGVGVLLLIISKRKKGNNEKNK